MTHPPNWTYTRDHLDELEEAIVAACKSDHDWNDREPPKLVAGYYVYRGEVTIPDQTRAHTGVEPGWNPNLRVARTRHFEAPRSARYSHFHGGLFVDREEFPYTGYAMIVRGWRLYSTEYPDLLQPPVEKCQGCPRVLECRQVLKGLS